MTAFLDLSLQGTKFTVPKSNLIAFFLHRPEMFVATTYEVQSSVTVEMLEVFAKALGTGTKVPLTKENAGALSLLARAFCLDELLSECSDLESVSIQRKHGGNVHAMGIVTVTSASIDSLRNFSNLVDLTNSASLFRSENWPSQWVCWDFHEMRVRPSHYTMDRCSLKSWVVQASLDGKAWT
jgi:hypothetical protein